MRISGWEKWRRVEVQKVEDLELRDRTLCRQNGVLAGIHVCLGQGEGER